MIPQILSVEFLNHSIFSTNISVNQNYLTKTQRFLKTVIFSNALNAKQQKNALNTLLNFLPFPGVLLQSYYYRWEILSHTSGHQNSRIFLNRSHFEVVPMKTLSEECCGVLWGFGVESFCGIRAAGKVSRMICNYLCNINLDRDINLL